MGQTILFIYFEEEEIKSEEGEGKKERRKKRSFRPVGTGKEGDVHLCKCYHRVLLATCSLFVFVLFFLHSYKKQQQKKTLLEPLRCF